MAIKHTYSDGKGKIVTKNLTFGKAIRENCLACSCGSSNEVKHCPVDQCPLYPFRFGKDPGRAKRALSEEQRKAMAERLAKYRK